VARDPRRERAIYAETTVEQVEEDGKGVEVTQVGTSCRRGTLSLRPTRRSAAVAIRSLVAQSHKSGFGVLCAEFSRSRIPPLGLSQISVQALCIETFKFVWVVGFRELEGSAGEPELSGAQKVLARNYDVTLGAVALTETE
jgi:hypothetical protein